MARAALSLLLLLLLLGSCASPPDPIAIEEDRRAERSEILEQALGSKDPAERTRALVAMGRIQSASYVEILAREAQRNQGETRIAALFALGQLALVDGPRLPRSGFAAVDSILDYPDAEIVAVALEALGKFGEPMLGHRIHPFVHHAVEQVRVEAVLALLRSRYVAVWRDRVLSPPMLPAPAAEAVVAALGDPAESVRLAAAATLARATQPGATEALVGALADGSPWVRMFAARALGAAVDVAGAEPLLALTRDPSEHVRAEAVAAIATLGGADRLTESLALDPVLQVRAALAHALARSTAVWSEACLRRLEQDTAPTVRVAAVSALATRLGAAYLGDLERHLAASDRALRVAAVRAAQAIPAARPLVERALGDGDALVVAAALEALGQAGEGASSAVRQALSATDPAIRGTAVDVFGASPAEDKAKVLRGVYDASAGEAWIEIRTSIVDAAAQLEGGRGLLSHAARTDPARAVRDRAEAAHRALQLEPPQPSFAREAPAPWLGQRFDSDPVIRLETTKGTLELQLFAREAPVHVASVVRLVRDHFYDGLAWHRVVANFVIQGGDPQGTGWGGPGYALRDEINRVRFERGTLGMPKGGRDSGGSQLFITQVPAPHLDGRYTAFGRVISGIEVVDRIEVGDRIVTARMK